MNSKKILSHSRRQGNVLYGSYHIFFLLIRFLRCGLCSLESFWAAASPPLHIPGIAQAVAMLQLLQKDNLAVFPLGVCCCWEIGRSKCDFGDTFMALIRGNQWALLFLWNSNSSRCCLISRSSHPAVKMLPRHLTVLRWRTSDGFGYFSETLELYQLFIIISPLA